MDNTKKKRILKNPNFSSNNTLQKTVPNNITIVQISSINKSNVNNLSDNDESDEDDDGKSINDIEIKNFHKNEEVEEEEDEKTPFQEWKDKLYVKFSCEIHILESEDMEKEDININKFYEDFELIKAYLKDMFNKAKEYKELDFSGRLLTYEIHKNSYELNVNKCNNYLNLIKDETKDKLLTTREDKKAKREYNSTIKELKSLKKIDENEKLEKIIKYRKYLFSIIEQKKKYLKLTYNIIYDPFLNRLNI